MLKIKFLGIFDNKLTVRMCARMSVPLAHVRTSKVIYARTRMHISENFPAPICTKIAAPARVRVRTKVLLKSKKTPKFFWYQYNSKVHSMYENEKSNGLN